MKRFIALFILLSLVFLIGCDGGTTTTSLTSSELTPSGFITGTVTEKGTGETLSGVTVSVNGKPTTTTNSEGYYSITIAPGTYTLKFEKVNYRTVTITATVTNGNDTIHSVGMVYTASDTWENVSWNTTIWKGCTPQGGKNIISIGAVETGVNARMLIDILLDYVLPSGAKVTSAKLKLYRRKSSPSSGLPIKYAIYPLKEEWSIYYATWDIRDNNTPWSTPGGTYYDDHKVTEGSFELGEGEKWIEVDITKAYNYWLEDGMKTNGIIILPTEPTTSYIDFISSYNSNYCPYVKIYYYIP